MSVGREKAIRIFSRDGNKCKSCGNAYPPSWEVPRMFVHKGEPPKCLVVDHVVPGAGSDDDNLQTLCWFCNSSKGGKSQAAFDLFKAVKLLGRPVAYYPSIAHAIGIKASLFLCQLIYWTPRARNDRGEGWLYKSCEEMEAETGLSYKEQCGARETLCNIGILEEKYDRTDHRLFFRINFNGLTKLLASDKMEDAHLTKGKMVADEMEDATLQKVSSYKESETTTENTAGSAICPECEFRKDLCTGHRKKKVKSWPDRKPYNKEIAHHVEAQPTRSKGEERAERTRKALEVLDHPERLPEHLQRAIQAGRNRRNDRSV